MSTSAGAGSGATVGARTRIRPGIWLAAAAVATFLLVFLVLPVARVFYAAFVEADGSLTVGHFAAFFGQGLMREAFFNSLFVALMSALFAALIAVPLAYFTVRFRFRGAIIIQTLGVLPLIMPPFVGAVALQLIFGRSGTVNLLLNDAFGFTLPIMEGLTGLIFVEAIHYFPFILMNLTVALRNIDGAMEEAALNLGCRGWRLFWRVIFPLALPGFVAGASLVFVKVFDDLGTPLVMGQTNLLAPQAYLRITQVGLEDPLGYVISVILIAFSIAAMALSARALRGRDFASVVKGGTSLQQRKLSPLGALAAWGWIVLVLLVTLSPHLGVLLLSFAQVWSFSPLPDAYTLQHYATVFGDSSGMIRNTLVYCGLAAALDVVIGVTLAYLDAAHHAAGAAMAGLGGHRLAGGAGHRAGHRLPAPVQGHDGARHRRAADQHLGADHDRLRGAASAVRAALLRGRAAAAARVTGGGGREPGRRQGAHHPPRGGAADDGRHPGRLRHQLHHRGGGAVGHTAVGVGRLAGPHELRHLPLHAKRGRPRPRCRPGRAGHCRGGPGHLVVAPHRGARGRAGAQLGDGEGTDPMIKSVSVQCHSLPG